MSTAKISAPISGDKLYQERARAALPLLVRQAQAGAPIFYSDLAEELGMPNPRNLNYVLGSIGQSMELLSKSWKEKVPPIQCLVINKATGLPGEGIDAQEKARHREREHDELASADIVDFEMSNEPAHVRLVREVSRANGTKMIMSFHDFHHTPGLELLNQRFLEAERLGADIAKVAVMPRNLDDVLTLLNATLQSSQKLEIPLVSMSMGGYGSLTRMFGWVFGSAITFAIGGSSSAPGQVPIEDLNAVLGILRKSVAGP